MAFCLREQHPKEKPEPFAQRLAGTIGEELQPANLRQLLSRAYSLFGRALLEEVVHLLGDSDPQAVKDQMEKLNVIEYARKSKYCRAYLSLD